MTLFPLAVVALAAAADVSPADVRSLNARPAKLTLRGGDDAQQLLLTATLADGRLQDLTGDVRYEVADAAVATVSPSGRVTPRANGSTHITARFGDRTVTIPVEA